MTSPSIPVAVAYGDGIGPEIMSVTLELLKEAGSPLAITPIEIGEKIYLRGEKSGIAPSAWEVIKESKAFLKAPITTPQGGGFKSVNVALRTALGLYANIRPCVAYAPFIETKHPHMDLVIVRENEEDVYMGIEYQWSDETVEARKIMTTHGCRRIIRHAFEYAVHYNRKKVSCFTKDNILKMSDGLFHRLFEEIATDYPHIEKEHWIVDIGAAKLADTPTAFDVIVMPNLYGDILSDVAAQIAGSVGLAGSSNIGAKGAMFEAIHGSAPRRAHQNMANPSGLIHAAIQMLVHIDLNKQATLIHNAWLKTIEEGIHTYDIFKENKSQQKVGTREFAKAVAKRLGQTPEHLPPVDYDTKRQGSQNQAGRLKEDKKRDKELVGVDIFLTWADRESQTARGLAQQLSKMISPIFQLEFISNRGVKVWPNSREETLLSDCWRLRLIFQREPKNYSYILSLLETLVEHKIDVVQVQSLYSFDKKAGFSD